MKVIVMPRLDPGMQSGKIIEWLKNEGQQVAKGEAVVVVEGEKTTFEIESTADGKLHKILAQPGEDILVTQPVAIIQEPNESLPADMGPVMAAKPPAGSMQSQSTQERVTASPAARRLAQEYGIELTALRGTGPGGRIQREDVEAHAQALKKSGQAPTAASAVIVPAGVRRLEVERTIPLTGIRKTVAERLSHSFRTVVPVTITMEVDMAEVQKLREKNPKLSVTGIIIRAVSIALERHPKLNSTLETETIKILKSVNVAVAVDTPQGLFAPVVPDANKKSPLKISDEVAELSSRAQVSKLSLEELTGGTFTVSNLGGYGVDEFAPVINPPQCAILGVGRVMERPVVTPKGITARPMCSLSLVFDHRIVDGAPAARFLQEVKGLLENPSQL